MVNSIKKFIRKKLQLCILLNQLDQLINKKANKGSILKQNKHNLGNIIVKFQNLKIASALTVFTLGVVSSIGLSSQPAYAHKKCYKQSLGFPGSWTWVCKPHGHLPSGRSESSCLAVVTPPTKYRLVNRTRKVVYYRLNGRSYRLNPTYQRTHKVGGGSNGCNIASNRAVVTFDNNTVRSGTQKTTYTLNRGGLSKGYEYYFASRNNSVSVRLLPRNLKTPLRVEGGKDTIHVSEPKKQQPKNTPPVESTKPPQPQSQPPVKEEDNSRYIW